MKHFSILHVSDLHKGRKANYLNLFSSLKSDCEEYIAMGIPKPEIIVVSGDLIEGATGCDANKEIAQQYSEVELFLNDIVKYFLNGDKSRIIIVPGNHDFNREISIQSMVASSEEPKDDYKRLKSRDENVRWSWSDFKFYHIQDIDKYNERFTQFEAFYNRFYSSIRTLPLDCEKNGYIVDLPNYNISFSCFNSCHRLDHLNPEGCICPDAISVLHDELSALYKMGRLIFGVWHHHISGLPNQNNYLDKRILNEMMAKHIQIGLFGHQHISDVVSEHKDLTSQNKILLISSGSLYGGSKQLPQGFSRQYNIIEIKFNNNDVELVINVRKDCSEFLYDIPTWQTGTIGYSSMRNIAFELSLVKPEITYLLDNIDKEARFSKDYKKACLELRTIGLDNPIVSKFLDSYIKEIDDSRFLIDCIGSPKTATQCLTILNAAIELKDKNILSIVLDYEYVLKCNVSYIVEYRNKAEDLKNRL